MRDKLRALKNDSFLRHNAIFLAGNVAVGFLNYVFYPIVGRLLEPIYFGEVQVLFSIVAHVAVFFNVMGLVVVNIVANHPDAKTANRLITELEKLAIWFSLLSFGLLLIFVIPLTHFFHFTSAWPFVALALAIILSVPITFRRAILQGIKDFTSLSWAGVINSVVKLVGGVGAVLAGFKTLGTMGALLAAQIIGLVYIDWRLKRDQTKYQWHGYSLAKPDLQTVRPELKYGGLVLLVSLLFTVMYSVDVLMVKHYFQADKAGLYAGISTIANTIYFISGSVAGVLLASVKIGAKGNTPLLKRSILLNLGLGSLTLVIFALAPRLVIGGLIGDTYADYAHYLPSITLALFILSIANLLFIYYMAQRAYWLLWLVLVGSILIVLLMIVNHGSIQAIINNVIAGSIVLLLSVSVLGSFRKNKQTEI